LASWGGGNGNTRNKYLKVPGGKRGDDVKGPERAQMGGKKWTYPVPEVWGEEKGGSGLGGGGPIGWGRKVDHILFGRGQQMLSKNGKIGGRGKVRRKRGKELKNPSKSIPAKRGNKKNWGNHSPARGGEQKKKRSAE